MSEQQQYTPQRTELFRKTRLRHTADVVPTIIEFLKKNPNTAHTAHGIAKSVHIDVRTVNKALTIIETVQKLLVGDDLKISIRILNHTVRNDSMRVIMVERN